MNTTVTRYDTAFYVQALDRFVATESAQRRIPSPCMPIYSL